MPYKDVERQRQYQRVWKQSRLEKIRELKTNKPCLDCGGVFHFSAMQWDHLPGTVKVRNIGNMAQYQFQRVLEEIEKCDLVCANCHSVRTYNRRINGRSARR